jgi:hypothetical protein
MQIAREFWEVQRGMIKEAADRVAKECGSREIIVAGIGAPLFARELDGIDLTRELGSAADALPALAVREVAKRNRCL